MGDDLGRVIRQTQTDPDKEPERALFFFFAKKVAVP